MVPVTAINRAAQLGLGTGLRSMTPLAALSWAASTGRAPAPSGSPLQLLRNRVVARLLLLMAAGELVADKLPMTPKRTMPASLIGRVGLGALCGVVVCSQEQQPAAVGAGIGALAAGWSTYAATAGRAALTEMGLPDVAVALAEDVLASALSVAAVHGRQWPRGQVR